jgi:hypothetical protein
MNSLARFLFLLGVFILPGVLRRVHWKPGRKLPSAQVILSEAALWTRAFVVVSLFVVGVVTLGVMVELILLGPAWLGWLLSPVVVGLFLITGQQVRLVSLGWRERERRRQDKRTAAAVTQGEEASKASPEARPEQILP